MQSENIIALISLGIIFIVTSISYSEKFNLVTQI